MFARLPIMKRCGLLFLCGFGSNSGRISKLEMQYAMQMLCASKVYGRTYSSSTKRLAAKEEKEVKAQAILGTTPKQSSNNKVSIKTKAKAKTKAVGKALIIESVKRDTFLKRELVEKVFESFFRNVKQDISKGTVVGLNNFGTFYLKVLKSRKSCHPKTGEVINILEKRKMAFTHEIVDPNQWLSINPAAAASDADSGAKIEGKEYNSNCDDDDSQSSDSEDTDDDSDDEDEDDDEEEEEKKREKKKREKKCYWMGCFVEGIWWVEQEGCEVIRASASTSESSS